MVVGLVGCGNWGRHILRDLVALGCEVPVVARSRESIARAEEGGAVTTVGVVRALPTLDAVVVATPTTTHAVVLEEVLQRDVPVFCEKPLTDDPEAAERLAARAPDTLFVMDKWRYQPGGERARCNRPRTPARARVGTADGAGRDGGIHMTTRIRSGCLPHTTRNGYEILGTFGEPESAVGQWQGEARCT